MFIYRLPKLFYFGFVRKISEFHDRYFLHRGRIIPEINRAVEKLKLVRVHETISCACFFDLASCKHSIKRDSRMSNFKDQWVSKMSRGLPRLMSAYTKVRSENPATFHFHERPLFETLVRTILSTE